ncbi:MAG: cupin domain-containing protein [Deltaproteobacteria bacterium]|nr:cupin domain-containing protein [Deltaproteobacteria bacterium]
MGESLWLSDLSPAFEWPVAETTPRVRAWKESVLTLPSEGTHYVIAYEGHSTLERADGSGPFPLVGGMFACVPGGAVVRGAGSKGAGLVITHAGYVGCFQVGGPIEAVGRLRYIDGCTDSLLVAPPLLGDPCLNHLHIPAGTTQTRHVHPSVRVGLIVKGEGVCVTPGREIALRPGLAFLIPPDRAHSFCTSASSLDVVVYHPDSDTGPTHQDHPMLNRTLIRGS